MATTRQEIRQWLKRGKAQKATHMLVVCDTFSYEDYPVFVKPGEDVHKVAESYNKNMQKLMEVYNLKMDLDTQLFQRRSFNY
jgi:hypothetical protein